MTQITVAERPKRWLVFMETEIRKCTKMMFGLTSGDMITLLGCLSYPHKPTKRCYLELSFLSQLTGYTIYPNSMHITSSDYKLQSDSSCNLTWHLYSRIYVHKLFTMKLSIPHFIATYMNFEHPLEGKCSRTIPSVRITYDGGFDVHCGRKYPWSIYSHSGMAIVDVFTFFGANLNVKMSIDIIDSDFLQTQPQLYTSSVTTWSAYRIQVTVISVDFLHRIFISKNYDLDKVSSHAIHDGPNSMVPYLKACNNKQGGLHYISSTHQVYIVYLHPPNVSVLRLHYTKYGNPMAHTLRPTELITLVNNTGCGYSDHRAWKCSFNISTSHHEYAVLRLMAFDITGPFKNMPTSAGIAVYNVVNSSNVLVHHWYKSKKGNLVITGTEQQLLVVVYAYSSLANVSCQLATGVSNCVGIFLSWDLKTSIFHITKQVDKQDPFGFNKTTFVATLNVVDNCFLIQTSDLPRSPGLRNPEITLVFVYKSALKITKCFGRCGIRCHIFKINGDYKPINVPNREKLQIQSFVGPIKSIVISEGYAPLVLFMISHIPCVLPCQEISPITAHIFAMIKRCDICSFVFIDNIICNMYITIENTTITIKRILGDLPLNIEIGSPQFDARTRMEEWHEIIDFYIYSISYYVDGIALQLEEHRVVKVCVASNGLWRIPRGSMKIYQEISPFPFIPKELKVFRFGMYEYFVARGSRLTDWNNETKRCHTYGGHLLTIFDQRELDFVVQNIIKPFKIEIAWIGMRRQVFWSSIIMMKWSMASNDIDSHKCKCKPIKLPIVMNILSEIQTKQLGFAKHLHIMGGPYLSDACCMGNNIMWYRSTFVHECSLNMANVIVQWGMSSNRLCSALLLWCPVLGSGHCRLS